MSSDDFKTSELNLYSLDRKNKYKFSDATGLIPGLSSVAPILKLESDISADGYRGSVAIPNMLYKIQNSEYYGYLSYTIYSLENADSVLTQSIANEVKTRSDTNAVIVQSVVDEVSNRTIADTALSGLISDEMSNRVGADQKLTTDLAVEVKRAGDAEAKIASDLAYESKRAGDVEADLQTKINFVVSNTDAKAIDSITELLSAFQGSDNSLLTTIANLTTRMVALETTVANLRGKA